MKKRPTVVIEQPSAGSAGASQQVVPAPNPPDFSGAVPHRVLQVIDPAAVVVKLGDQPTTVRLLGVQLAQAAEDDDRTIAEAARYLKQTVQDKFVFLDFDESVARTDQQGVPVAYLYRAEDHQFVNYELIRQGYAVAATDYSYKHRQLFTAAQREAEKAKRGVWASARSD